MCIWPLVDPLYNNYYVQLFLCTTTITSDGCTDSKYFYYYLLLSLLIYLYRKSFARSYNSCKWLARKRDIFHERILQNFLASLALYFLLGKHLLLSCVCACMRVCVYLCYVSTICVCVWGPCWGPASGGLSNAYQLNGLL